MAYATTTDVPVERSKAEIETLLIRHGCDAVATAWDGKLQKAVVQFRMGNRHMRFQITIPDPGDEAFIWSSRGKRTTATQVKLYHQAIRSRWRSLLLCIKAKIEAVESDIETVDEAFMAQLVLPDGQTVGQKLLPAVCEAYKTGTLPPVAGLLTSGG